MADSPTPKRIYSYATPVEFKLVTIRECPMPYDQLLICDNAEPAVAYWRSHVATTVLFNPDCECLTAIILNARLRIKGHQLLTIGTMDMLLAHPREIFRTAIVASAFALVLVHNHPSGDPSPSEADIRLTRDIIRGGQLLKIELSDHIIVGGDKHVSLRQLGYFYS